MLRTSIPITTVGFQQGTEVHYTPADAIHGMKMDNVDDTILLIKNASNSSMDVTIRAVADEAGRSVDYVQTIGAGKEGMIAPLRPVWWNQRNVDIGKVHVDFSASAFVSVAAFKIQR
jgi:hypothetical protein